MNNSKKISLNISEDGYRLKVNVRQTEGKCKFCDISGPIYEFRFTNNRGTGAPTLLCSECIALWIDVFELFDDSGNFDESRIEKMTE